MHVFICYRWFVEDWIFFNCFLENKLFSWYVMRLSETQLKIEDWINFCWVSCWIECDSQKKQRNLDMSLLCQQQQYLAKWAAKANTFLQLFCVFKIFFQSLFKCSIFGKWINDYRTSLSQVSLCGLNLNFIVYSRGAQAFIRATPKTNFKCPMQP